MGWKLKPTMTRVAPANPRVAWTSPRVLQKHELPRRMEQKTEVENLAKHLKEKQQS